MSDTDFRLSRSWLRDIAVAGLFLTRLPFRPKGEVGPGELADAGWAYPVIGLLAGGAAGGVLWLGAVTGLHPLACALLGLAAGALVTGALHEDGLADVADGFGGGHDREAKLRIMRDSRIGSYGVLALIIGVGLKAAILSGLPGPGIAAAALIAAAVLSRSVLPAVMLVLGLARTDGLAANAGRAKPGVCLAALIIGCLAAWPLFGPGIAVAAILAAAAAAAAVAMIARRQIGGYTGDVLGATQQVAEVFVLIAAGAMAQ